MTIRELREDDTTAVRALTLEAFEDGPEADLIEALRKGGAMALELVAEMGGEVIGHVALSAMIEPEKALGLAPLSVAKAHRRDGQGATLVRDALERARSAGWRSVFVLGEPDYYERFGFSAEAAERFDSPYSGRYFLALPLRPGALDQGCAARYARAFDAV